MKDFKEFKVNVFGRTHTIDWEFESRNVIKALEALKQEVREPHILDITNIPPVTFYAYEKCDGLYSSGVLDFIRNHSGDYCNEAISKMNDMQWLMAISDVDKEWGDNRNMGLTGRFYEKVTFPDWFADIITQECDRLADVVQTRTAKAIAETEAEALAARREKEKLMQGIQWKTKEHTVHDEGGKTIEYDYDISYNGNTYHFCDRNVFDFGRVTNYKNGMIGRRDGIYVLEHFDKEHGWRDFPLTEDEQHVAEVVTKYGMYAKSHIRMDSKDYDCER